MNQSKHMLLCFLGFVYTTGACAHEITTPPWSADKSYKSLTIAEQEECMVHFGEILSIQDKRNTKTDEMAKLTIMRKNKEISKKKYLAFYEVWLSNENMLAGKVNKLYLVATDKGCFKKIEE